MHTKYDLDDDIDPPVLPSRHITTAFRSTLLPLIMGQGYSLTTLSAGSAGIDVPELSDMVYEKSLGSARFMKSIRARQRNGLAFVKVIMKPYPSMQLDPYVRTITRKSRLLAIFLAKY